MPWPSAVQADRVQEEHRAARLTADAQVGGTAAAESCQNLSP